MNVIPHSRPTLGEAEAAAVHRVVLSGQIAQGRMVERLERDFAEAFRLGHAAAVNSGTAGLHLALLALGIGPGDQVIIPSYVCTAVLNAVYHAGAEPVLADIDPDTFNMDSRDAAGRVTSRTRAIIVPHMFGAPADLDGLLAIGIPLIEDCAQAVGALYHGRPLGAFGGAAVFSFYATKMMTTGEGGLVASRDQKIIERIVDLRNYDNRTDYRVRFNYKMTDLQAAMGLSQLGKLETFIIRRQEIAGRYNEALCHFRVILPPDTPGRIYFRYVVRVPDDAGPWIDRLARRGITCARPVFRPLHHYLNLTGYEQSDAAWRTALSIPIYPSLTDQEADTVIAALKECLEEMES
ncbi:MAG: DegT/DnrJ/EryC1/StrS family aminotransferase [Thermodesulfobacteriota bacterium]